MLDRRHVSVGFDVWRVVWPTEVEKVDMGDDTAGGRAGVSVVLTVRRVGMCGCVARYSTHDEVNTTASIEGSLVAA